MTLSDIGVLWLWLILVADLALRFLRPGVWKALRDIGRALRDGWFEFRNRKPHYKDEEPFDDFISTRLSHLLRSGLHHATYQFGELGTDERLEFKKYIHAPGDYGIELIYRRKTGRDETFRKVNAQCEASGLPVRIETTSKKQIPKTLRVHLGQNIDQACRLAESLWTEVLCLSADTPRSFKGRDISPYGELIDRPDQEILPYREGMHYLFRDADTPPEFIGCGAVLWIFFVPIVFYGVLISTLSNHGDPKQWSVAFNGITVGSSATSLAFLCLYLLITTVGRPITRKVFRHANKGDPPWLRKVSGVSKWIVRLTLPLAVFLVWSGK